MRLIDADKLENDIAENITVKAVSRMLVITQGQPTVKAIPIEFIKQLIEKFDCERGNAIKDTFAHILTGLLEFWEFEQEKENDGRNC